MDYNQIDINDFVAKAFKETGYNTDSQYYVSKTIEGMKGVLYKKLVFECTNIMRTIDNYSCIGVNSFMYVINQTTPSILINPICSYLRSKGFLVIGGCGENPNVDDYKIYIHWVSTKGD